MSVIIKAHFDGKTIVPDEPVNLPLGTPITAELTVVEPAVPADEIKRRLAALRQLEAMAVKGVSIPLEASRRENMYDPDRGL